MRTVTTSWKTQAIIGLSALLCIAIVAGALLFFERETYGPADLIPADRTLAYFEHIDAATAGKLQTYMPSLATVIGDDAFTVALVRTDGGEKAWIRFADGDITASNPEALTLLRTGEPLSRSAAFRSLSRMRTPGDAFAYVLPASADVQAPAGLRRTDDPAAVSITGDEMRIGFLAPVAARATPMMSATSGTTLSMSAGDLRATIAFFASALTGDKRTAWEALLRTHVLERFGASLSMEYDIAPLFAGPASIAVTTQGDESILTLRGRNARARATIDALHEAAESNVARARRFTRTYDETFTVDTILSASDTGANETRTVGAWTVRSSGEALHSAVNGDDFIMSTDSGAVMRALAEAPMSDARGRIAGGMIDLEVLRASLARFAPGDALPFPAALAPGPRFEWSLERTGDASVLRLR